MKFLITITGRTNVGKSTIFNCLTNSCDALVFNYDGVTRDRQYGQANYNNLDYLVADTGGISDIDSNINRLINKQSEIAINEANIIFFVVDGILGLTSVDRYIANILHKKNKETIVVVNKIDNMENSDMLIAEFYSLGFNNIFAISAAHSKNIDNLLNKFLKKPLNLYYQNNITTKKIIKKSNYIINISLIGQPNVGKSTFVNKILGQDRVIVSNTPGTTINNINTLLNYFGKKYNIVDTPGIRKKSKIKKSLEIFSLIKTIKTIKNSNIVILIINAKNFISDQDFNLINLIIKNGKALILIINKCDLLTKNKLDRLKNNIKKRLFFISNYIDIHFTSALYSVNINNIFKSINIAYNYSIKKISTSNITRLLHRALNNHLIPRINNFKIKIKYAHIGGHNPLIIVIHGNRLNKLPNTYKKYLENFFKKSLNFRGNSIFLEFKE